jgi:hypothetical protein
MTIPNLVLDRKSDSSRDIRKILEGNILRRFHGRFHFSFIGFHRFQKISLDFIGVHWCSLVFIRFLYPFNSIVSV